MEWIEFELDLGEVGRSLFLNYELMVAFHDGDAVQRFGAWFEREKAQAGRYAPTHANGSFGGTVRGDSLIPHLAIEAPFAVAAAMQNKQHLAPALELRPSVR